MTVKQIKIYDNVEKERVDVYLDGICLTSYHYYTGIKDTLVSHHNAMTSAESFAYGIIVAARMKMDFVTQRVTVTQHHVRNITND